ncbi:hypothetical protein A4S05_25380 [Nostoc sp. KVJ20]|nr:hypothetical protein A4S05_25380 [Nostoc sp. KVJ20]
MEANTPKNCQQTAIRLIPEDWEVKNLAEIIIAGPKNGYSGRSGRDARGTPTLRLTATSSGYLILNDETVKRLDEIINPSSELFLQPGDVLIQRSNTYELVGTTAIFDGSPRTYIYPDLMMRLRFEDQSTAHWFWRYANSFSGRRFFLSVAAGSTGSMPKISGAKLRGMTIPFPPLPEQKAIAQSLSDIDALITECDRLITKKRNNKQGTMEQLLTGKKRLPGFGKVQGYKQTEIGMIPDDWNLLDIADIVENNRVPSGIYKEKTLYGKGIKIIKLSDVFSLDYFDPAKAKRVVINGNELLSYRVRVGDIFIALASVKLEGVGKVMLVTELDEETAYDHNVALIRANEVIDAKFLFYMLKSNLVRREISKLSTQVGTTFLKSSTILKFKLPVPAVKVEQASIATVLSDMDTEIAGLEQKRDKYKAIKQGMMQELLTGKTRLISSS